MGKEDFGSEATRRCSIGKWVQLLRSTALTTFNQTWGKSASAVLPRTPTVPYWSELWRRGRDLGMEDSDKNIWIATFGDGIYRIHGQAVDHFGRADGLSSDTVSNLYEGDDGVV